jgi:hypothetical protein
MYGVKKLAEIEHKLNTVLNLINTAVNTDTNENTFAILSEQESGRVAVIQEIHKLSDMRCPGTEHAGEVPDEWIAVFDLVPNLSFQNADTANVRALKSALLGDPAQHSLITAYGMGGAGKTTACKMAAGDAEVVSRFKDGVLWLELGGKCTSAELFGRLARVVEQSGGKSIAEEIRVANDANLDNGKAAFQEWFRGRAVLFVVDNIWETGDRIFNDWIEQIRRTSARESAVLFSSPTPLGDKDIEFAPLDQQEATELFIIQLGESEGFEGNGEWAKTILEGCAGLPLALSMAAAYLRKDRTGWQSLSARITSVILRGVTKISGHRGLPSVFEASLDWLERDGRPGGADKCKYSWTDIYLSLSIIGPSSAGIPVSVLAPMLGVCVEFAEAACVKLVNTSLATLSAGAPADRKIKLHDLQLQYCVDQCEQTAVGNALSGWHAKALECLTDELSAPPDVASQYVTAFCAMDNNK